MHSRQEFIDESRRQSQAAFPGTILVEGWTPDQQLQAKWERWGYVCLFPLTEDGLQTDDNGNLDVIMSFDEEKPVAPILLRLGAAIAAGKLLPTAYRDAVNEIEIGTFDLRRWHDIAARHSE